MFKQEGDNIAKLCTIQKPMPDTLGNLGRGPSQNDSQQIQSSQQTQSTEFTQTTQDTITSQNVKKVNFNIFYCSFLFLKINI